MAAIPTSAGKKGLIVYFSQAGANAQVAEAVARGLRASRYEVDLWNLKDGSPPDVTRYGLLGIGSPVYYYRIPFNVADFARRLPRLEGVPAFAYVVSGPHGFDAGNALRGLLERTGAREVGYFETRGAAYFLGHLREGYLFSASHPTSSDLLEAERFGTAVAERVAGAPYTRPQAAPKLPPIYRLERLVASRWLVRNVYTRFFKVNHSKCTACNLCMERCPTSNITRDARGHPLWGRECLGCFSCEKDCPEEAITSFISRPLTRLLVRPFFAYNCRTWRREPASDHVRVIQRRGQTVRVGSGAGKGGGPPPHESVS
jgi:Pyruvate/2-oxoacid:ferredoxin oxidoreductase delta subunit/flavodoxin